MNKSKHVVGAKSSPGMLKHTVGAFDQNLQIQCLASSSLTEPKRILKTIDNMDVPGWLWWTKMLYRINFIKKQTFFLRMASLMDSIPWFSGPSLMPIVFFLQMQMLVDCLWGNNHQKEGHIAQPREVLEFGTATGFLVTCARSCNRRWKFPLDPRFWPKITYCPRFWPKIATCAISPFDHFVSHQFSQMPMLAYFEAFSRDFPAS